MTKISVSVTPKEHRFLTLAAKTWAKRTGYRAHGKGPVAAFVRECLREHMTGGGR